MKKLMLYDSLYDPRSDIGVEDHSIIDESMVDNAAS